MKKTTLVRFGTNLGLEDMNTKVAICKNIYKYWMQLDDLFKSRNASAKAVKELCSHKTLYVCACDIQFMRLVEAVLLQAGVPCKRLEWEFDYETYDEKASYLNMMTARSMKDGKSVLDSDIKYSAIRNVR